MTQVRETGKPAFDPGAAGSELLGRVRERLDRVFLACEARLQHASTLRYLRARQTRPRRILFLCLGNICRSPLAGQLAARCMPWAQVESAGFLPSGRPSPEFMRVAASRVGIDLGHWESHRVNAALILNSDLIVLLDVYNFRDLRREFPAAVRKGVLLGRFLERPATNIKDPYGTTLEETMSVARRIEEAVERLAGFLVTFPQSEKSVAAEPPLGPPTRKIADAK